MSFDAIDEMARENKGAFGAALAGIWLKDRLKKDPLKIVDQDITDPDPRMWFAQLGKHRCTYGKVNDNGVEEVSWEPDYSFNLTLPDYNISKEVIVEAKTGDGRLTRDQAEVMELVAQQDDTVVYLCKITLDSVEAELRYERFTAEG